MKVLGHSKWERDRHWRYPGTVREKELVEGSDSSGQDEAHNGGGWLLCHGVKATQYGARGTTTPDQEAHWGNVCIMMNVTGAGWQEVKQRWSRPARVVRSEVHTT